MSMRASLLAMSAVVRAGLTGGMSDELILVTGATGKTGRRVVRLLQERGIPVREGSRSGSIRFDWDDPATWEPALRGVTATYLVVPTLGAPQATEAVAAFARQAAGLGVRRVVLVSLPAEGAADHGPVAAAEQALGEAGLEWTALRLRWFFQNFSEDFLRDPVLGGEVRLPAGEALEAFVDADDIAEVAVAALTGSGHDGKVYELTGPRLLTFHDTVEAIAEATGRDVRYVPLTAEEYADEQRALGVPEEWVQVSDGFYAQFRAGNLASVSDDVERVLGRPPRDFADFVKAAAADGAWSA